MLPFISKAQLTVEQIMRDPKWIGTSPSEIFWSYDSKAINFRWNPEKITQPLVLGRGRLQFAHLRVAVCPRAIANAVAAAGLVRRRRRLWLPALVARGYDAHLATVVARPCRRYCRVAAAGCGHRAFPGRGNAGGLAPS